ncbi:MAG: DUF4340 domain-containing protein [bacterium]
MKIRQLIWLVGVVIVLAILYLVVKSTSIPVAKETTLPQVDTSDVTVVTTVSQGDTVRLERTENGWMLTQPLEWPVNPAYMNQAMRQIADMRIETEVTSNPERFAEFGVDDSGLHLTLVTGKKTVDLILGNPVPTSGNSYARLAQDSITFQVRGNPKSAFSRTADSWRDRSIVTVPPDQIIRFAMDGLQMKREQGQPWKQTFPVVNDSVDTPLLQRRFDTVARLSATSFATGAEAAKLDWNLSKENFEVESVSGTAQRVHFLKADDNRFYVKRNDEPTIFFVPKTAHDRIFVDLRNEILGKKEKKK